MSYEQIISESSQNAFIVGGAKSSTSFISSKIGANTQVYNARQGTRFATQNLVQIQPLTSVPQNLIESGGYIDYQLRTPQGFLIDDLSLEIKIKNNGAAAAKLPMSFFLADRVEFYAGTQLLGTEEHFANYLKTMLTTVPSQLEVSAPYFNVNHSTYVELEELAAGSTKSYMLPVNQIFKNLIPSLINEELRIRVHYASKNSYDTTADLSLISTVLWIDGRILHSSDYKIYADNYLSGNFIHRTYESRIHKFPMNITNGSELTAVLSSMHGTFLGFFVYVQHSNATSTDLHTPLSNVIDTLHLCDQTSKILFGGSTNSRELLKYRGSQEYTGSRLFSIKDIIPISVSPNIWSDWVTGSLSGVVSLRAMGEKLIVNTESVFPFGSTTLGTQNICIIGIQSTALKISKAGKIIALR